MKKMVALLAAMMMAISVSAWAADSGVNPKEEQARKLRGEALKLQMQSESLTKQAIALEKEVLESEKKPGEKMRGRSEGSYMCVRDCLDGHGDLYSCRSACGGYN